MAKVNLTAGRIREFSTSNQQAFLWDVDTSGLAVRATAAGAKVFIFQSRFALKDIRITIGDVATWGISQARTEARRLQALIDQGFDPRQERQERIAAAQAKRETAKRQDVTVREAWDAYIVARRPKWGERHYRNHLSMAKPGGEPRKRGRRTGESDVTVPGPIVPLLALKLADLNGPAVKAWLEPLAARTPTQAAQTYRALRAFLTWCADTPAFAACTHADACNRRMARDTLPKARAKDDCLQREQLAAWFAAVREIGNPVISSYLQALLLTGARREELAGLTWDAVDFQWNSLTIRDKVEGERTIPLTPYVAGLLAGLPRRSDWVFSSPTAATGRIQEPRIAHVKALSAAGLPHLSLHGLRRSFGTLSEWCEAPTGVVAQIMGHKPSALAEKHYRRRPLDLLRMWHARIEAWILEQADIPQPAERASGLSLVKTA
jgi:integrase